MPNTPPSLIIEVGTGVETFQQLADGDPVELTYGPQGGFHVWTSVRTRDTTVEQAQINVSTRFVDGGNAAGPASRWPARIIDRDGAREFAGMRNFIAQASAVRGQRLVLRAELIAADGRHGAGERIVVPR